jgi:hypothetical protein
MPLREVPFPEGHPALNGFWVGTIYPPPRSLRDDSDEDSNSEPVGSNQDEGSSSEE